MKWLICFWLTAVPALVMAQSKKKKLRMEQLRQQMDAQLTDNLKKHIQFLASDSLQGRRSGTIGEKKAATYLIQQYQNSNISPANNQQYEQTFDIDEGFKIADTGTHFVVNGKPLLLHKDYFPLGFSSSAMVKGTAALALNERKQPWFRDMKDWLEEESPHGKGPKDWYKLIQFEANKAAKKGATALCLYNSGKTPDNIAFVPTDTPNQVAIPVIYITASGLNTYFKDYAAYQTMEMKVSIVPAKRSATNIVAQINNHQPQTIVIGAHYDHLGWGEDGNALDTAHEVHNGADDNASGSAALLEIARLIGKMNLKNYNFLFVNFSAEEQGLLGSKYWLKNNSNTSSINCMINLDMVGRYDSSKKLTIGGVGTTLAWNDFLMNYKSGLQIKTVPTGNGPSDHASFYRANIPVLYFFTGLHTDYHKTSDDADKINYNGIKDIVKMICDLVEFLNAKEKLTFTPTADQDSHADNLQPMKVTLGILPDYSYAGTGIKAEKIIAGKNAFKAGLKDGDIIVQIGNRSILGIKHYMQVLADYNKGDSTILTILRGGEQKTVSLVFE